MRRQDDDVQGTPRPPAPRLCEYEGPLLLHTSSASLSAAPNSNSRLSSAAAALPDTALSDCTTGNTLSPYRAAMASLSAFVAMPSPHSRWRAECPAAARRGCWEQSIVSWRAECPAVGMARRGCWEQSIVSWRAAACTVWLQGARNRSMNREMRAIRRYSGARSKDW